MDVRMPVLYPPVATALSRPAQKHVMTAVNLPPAMITAQQSPVATRQLIRPRVKIAMMAIALILTHVFLVKLLSAETDSSAAAMKPVSLREWVPAPPFAPCRRVSAEVPPSDHLHLPAPPCARHRLRSAATLWWNRKRVRSVTKVHGRTAHHPRVTRGAVRCAVVTAGFTQNRRNVNRSATRMDRLWSARVENVPVPFHNVMKKECVSAVAAGYSSFSVRTSR